MPMISGAIYRATKSSYRDEAYLVMNITSSGLYLLQNNILTRQLISVLKLHPVCDLST